MISILIPTYNYSILKLVKEINRQCVLASIDYEIIVADDASTSIEIKEQNEEILSFKNCHYLKNSENLGRTATRNLLANHSNQAISLTADAFNTDIINNTIVSNGANGIGMGNTATAYVKNNISKEAQYYLCGHPEMVEDAIKILISNGVNDSNIIREKYTWAVQSK